MVVIHENRGLNPHIKDVTRRFGTEGFVALGVDCLSPMGGTPADEDQARTMIGQIKPADAIAYNRAALALLEGAPGTNGKVGAVGFCWGGGAGQPRWPPPTRPSTPACPITAASRPPTWCRTSERRCCCNTPASTRA